MRCLDHPNVVVGLLVAMQEDAEDCFCQPLNNFRGEKLTSKTELSLPPTILYYQLDNDDALERSRRWNADERGQVAVEWSKSRQQQQNQI